MRLAISSTGVIAFTKQKDILREGRSARMFSLHILKDGKTQTLISDTHTRIDGITFLDVGGREQLLVNQMPNFILVDIEKHKVGQRRLIFTCGAETPLFKKADNKALYVAFSPGFEIRELEVTPDTCHSKALCRPDICMNLVYDICESDGYLILTGLSDHGNVTLGISMNDWHVMWKIPMNWHMGELRVCPGPQGTVFLASPFLAKIVQLSVKDGTELTEVQFMPENMSDKRELCHDIVASDKQMKVSCIHNHNDTFYVSHTTGRTGEQIDWKISQLEFEYNSVAVAEYHNPFLTSKHYMRGDRGSRKKYVRREGRSDTKI